MLVTPAIRVSGWSQGCGMGVDLFLCARLKGDDTSTVLVCLG